MQIAAAAATENPSTYGAMQREGSDKKEEKIPGRICNGRAA
jgi:hypothetical protein